jgi:hypothetical protein
MPTTEEVINTGNVNETVFTEIYEWSPFKIIEIFISISSIFFVTPWLLYFIWYERYGDNHRRTLINQFASSQFYYAVFYNILGQALDVIITAFGPFEFYLCYIQQFIRGVVIFQLVQLSTSIFTTKYFYIFILKNPAGVHEEFWCRFINAWSLLFSCITEFVYQFLPGRRLMQFYICTGKFNNSLSNEKITINYVLISYIGVAVIWYLFAALKISKYKKYLKSITPVIAVVQDSQTKLALLKDTFQASLVNLAVIGKTFLIFFLNIIMKAFFSLLDPSSFHEQLHTWLYFFSNHGLIVLSYICAVVIYYSRNSVMCQTILREIKDDFLQLRERLSE